MQGAHIEVHASDDAHEKSVHDFVAAWAEEMDLDRFDLKWPGAPRQERQRP